MGCSGMVGIAGISGALMIGGGWTGVLLRIMVCGSSGMLIKMGGCCGILAGVVIYEAGGGGERRGGNALGGIS